MNLFTITGAVATTAIVVVAPTLAQPPMFKDMSLEAAKQKAGDRILLVDATADWCPPCKLMDRTTWVDERLVEWIDQNAVAIQIDVDEQRDTARELGIRVMPTMIVYKNGQEFDRIVGYRDADEMMMWLEEVQQADEPGQIRADRPADLEAAGDLPPVGEPGMVETRLERARRALETGDYEQATEEYLWLWENMHKENPATVGVRSSFVATEIARLTQEHEPACEEFKQRRDQLEAGLREQPTWNELGDWIVLGTRILNEPEPVLAWADRIKDDEAGIRTLRRYGFLVSDLFNEHQRLDLVGLLETNPRLRVEIMWGKVEMVQSPEGAGIFAMMDPMYDVDAMEPEDFEDPQLQDEIQRTARQRFMQDSTRLYASLLAAARYPEASEVAMFIREKAPSPLAEIELIGAAVEHDLAQRDHLNWLDEARPENEDDARDIENLRQQIRRQLETQPGDAERRHDDGEYEPGALPPIPPTSPPALPKLPPSPPSVPPLPTDPR